MSKSVPLQTLPSSKVRCRETDQELVFSIPPRPVIGWIGAVLIVAVLLVCWGFLAFVGSHVGWLFLPIGLFIAAIAFVVLGFFFLAVTQRYLTKTFVYVTRERLAVKTVLWGREEVETHKLSGQSVARLYWGDPRLLRRPGRRGPTTPQGIEVVLDDHKDDSSPVFGDSLSWGEQEWLLWRMNRFLGRAADADAPEGTLAEAEAVPLAVEGLPDEPLPPPDGIKVRMEEGVFEMEFVFPNAMEMGTRKGVGSIVIGAAIAGLVIFHIIQTLDMRDGVHDIAGLIVWGAFGLIGLLVHLMGLLRLFGRSRLKITPEKVTFRTTLLGIGPSAGVPTAEVLSVKRDAIRTASKQILYGDQLKDATRDQAELDWLIGEIALRIHAARMGTEVPPLRQRRRRKRRRRVPASGKGPSITIPYEIDQCPLPSGNDLNTLLPVEVGPFRREPFDDDETEVAGGEPIYVDYRSDEGEVFVELGICVDAEQAREAVTTAHIEASEPGAAKEFSPNTEPSFFRMVAPRGAFMAWSRMQYFFSASVRAKNGEEILDRFMKAFPY